MHLLDRSQARTPGSRLVHLDGLRAFAFLSVFLHHTFHVPLTWAGVDLFFVLSGFLITGILVRQDRAAGFFSTFYSRRFIRILPPYYLCVLIAYVFFNPEGKTDWGWYAAFLSNFADALSDRTIGLRVLVPMWSLAVEEQFYLVWPLLVFFLGERRLWSISIGLVVAAPLFRWAVTLHANTYMAVYELAITRIDLLAGGSLLALWPRRFPEHASRWAPHGWVLSAAAATVFAVCAIAFSDFRTGLNSVVFNTVGYSLVAAMMIGLVSTLTMPRRTWAEQLLSARPLVYLGSISYTMYLVHEMAISTAQRVGLTGFWMAISALLGSVAVAAVSWRYFERPLQLLKERMFPVARVEAARS